jgi:FkbH-like protein
MPDDLEQKRRVAFTDPAKRPEEPIRLAVAATFTAEPVEPCLGVLMEQLELPFELHFAPYDQILQQLLSPGSLLRNNETGFNFILLRMEDWLGHGGDPAQKWERLTSHVTQLKAALRSAVTASSGTFVVICCPTSDTTHSGDVRASISAMEQELSSSLSRLSGVLVITSARVLDLYPVTEHTDDYSNALGRIPYTEVMYAALGTMMARSLVSLRRPVYKVIALDCDNTLWSGVCAEDGVSELAVDVAHQYLQRFMMRQREMGMLLCLCSKNMESDVWRVFEQHPEMLLKREHITSSRINWNCKSDSLRSLARELGIDPSAFIFVDDNPLDCGEVAAALPEVETVCLSAAPEEWPSTLHHVWAFDHFRVTEEDRRRSEMYREQIARDVVRRSSDNLEEFLASLGLEVECESVTEDQLARVAQLTQRTNQFNTTGRRRTESELAKLLSTGSNHCSIVRVRDRFGDYGVVGMMTFAAAQECLVVDSFMLSCRVLGRRVEHAMLTYLGARARREDKPLIHIEFVPSDRNQPARDFLESLGSPKAGMGDSVVYPISAEAACELAPEMESLVTGAARE